MSVKPSDEPRRWRPPIAMLLLLVHSAATLFMTGLIWFVQVVHYPLAAEVGPEHFQTYQSAHMRLTGYVVGAPMLIEAVTAGALLVQQPAPLPAAALWLGAALLSVVWLSTVFLQIPAHDQLLGGLDPEVVRRLVVGNWFRTVAWSARALLCLWMIHTVMLNPVLAE